MGPWLVGLLACASMVLGLMACGPVYRGQWEVRPWLVGCGLWARGPVGLGELAGLWAHGL